MSKRIFCFLFFSILFIFPVSGSFAAKNSAGKDSRIKITFQTVKEDGNDRLQFTVTNNGKPDEFLIMVNSRYGNIEQKSAFSTQLGSDAKSYSGILHDAFMQEAVEKNIVVVYRCSDVKAALENCGAGEKFSVLSDKLENVRWAAKAETGVVGTAAPKKPGKDSRIKITFLAEKAVRDDGSEVILKQFTVTNNGKPDEFLVKLVSRFSGDGGEQEVAFVRQLGGDIKSFSDHVYEEAEKNIVYVYRCSDLKDTVMDCRRYGERFYKPDEVKNLHWVAKAELGKNDNLQMADSKKPEPAKTSDKKPETECELFAGNLRSCTPYTCEYVDPFINVKAKKIIVGMEGDKCFYKDTPMPNLECRIPMALAVRMADQIDASQAAKNFEMKMSTDTKTGKSVTLVVLDGKEYGEDTMNEAMNKGYCTQMAHH